jgi:hypothetical protein
MRASQAIERRTAQGSVATDLGVVPTAFIVLQSGGEANASQSNPEIDHPPVKIFTHLSARALLYVER